MARCKARKNKNTAFGAGTIYTNPIPDHPAGRIQGISTTARTIANPIMAPGIGPRFTAG